MSAAWVERRGSLLVEECRTTLAEAATHGRREMVEEAWLEKQINMFDVK